MKVRFQADADFDRRIVQAASRHEARIDLQLATAALDGAGLRGVPDDQVLAIAAHEGRILLSHDHPTQTVLVVSLQQSFIGKRKIPPLPDNDVI